MDEYHSGSCTLHNDDAYRHRCHIEEVFRQSCRRVYDLVTMMGAIVVGFSLSQTSWTGVTFLLIFD